jgi:hypothetical protein
VDLEMYGLQKREQMKQDDRNEKCMIVAKTNHKGTIKCD